MNKFRNKAILLALVACIGMQPMTVRADNVGLESFKSFISQMSSTQIGMSFVALMGVLYGCFKFYTYGKFKVEVNAKVNELSNTLKLSVLDGKRNISMSIGPLTEATMKPISNLGLILSLMEKDGVANNVSVSAFRELIRRQEEPIVVAIKSEWMTTPSSFSYDKIEDFDLDLSKKYGNGVANLQFNIERMKNIRSIESSSQLKLWAQHTTHLKPQLAILAGLPTTQS